MRRPRPIKVKYKASHVGAPQIFLLEEACKVLNEAFDPGDEGYCHCYLVGSALERPDWRDVDIRMIMSDEIFEKEFPGATIKATNWEFDTKWILLTTAISEQLSRKTGLPIDFQFQPQSHANKVHAKKRHSIGMKLPKPEPKA